MTNLKISLSMKFIKREIENWEGQKKALHFIKVCFKYHKKWMVFLKVTLLYFDKPASALISFITLIKSKDYNRHKTIKRFYNIINNSIKSR